MTCITTADSARTAIIDDSTMKLLNVLPRQ
jgi:hypothetical protein